MAIKTFEFFTIRISQKSDKFYRPQNDQLRIEVHFVFFPY